MTTEEFWQLYDEYDLREAEADYRAGIIAATLANIHRDPDKQQPYEPADFFLRLRRLREPKRMTAEQMEAALRSITERLGGKIETR